MIANAVAGNCTGHRTTWRQTMANPLALVGLLVILGLSGGGLRANAAHTG